MQHIRAVRIEHAFRRAGGAGRVAHAGGGILVERAPGEVAIDLADPFLVRHRVAQAGRRQVGRIGEHDGAFDRRQAAGQLLQERQEAEIGHDRAVFRVVDDPGDLLGKQARVDGVIDRPDAENAVPCFQVAPGVPGERRHPVAELDAVAVEPLRHFQGARAQRRVVGGVERPLHRARDHLASAVIMPGMVDDAMA